MMGGDERFSGVSDDDVDVLNVVLGEGFFGYFSYSSC